MERDISNILVVSKSTRYCVKAVQFGASLAKKYNAKLFVIHVIEEHPFGLEGWNLPLASLPQLEKEYKQMYEEAGKDLDRVIQQEKDGGMDVQEVIKRGDPEQEVLDFVEERGIDLIVMRAYKQGRLENMLFGRGRDAIIRKMPCSVLLVHDELPSDTRYV